MADDIDFITAETDQNVEFINPPNYLKLKVGSGGLDPMVIKQAQNVLETCNFDFRLIADKYLDAIDEAIKQAEKGSAQDSPRVLIANILYPTMQMKANGGMFRYPLVTRIADLFIGFLDSIQNINEDSMEVILAFQNALELIVKRGLKGDGGQQGQHLVYALTGACARYYDKHPDKKTAQPVILH